MRGESWYRLLWEQPFVDLWSIPHTLVGTIIAYGARRYKVNIWLAFSFSLFFGVAWEIFEATTGISASEFFANHFSDILVNQVGFAAGWLVFVRVDDDRALRIFWWVFGVFMVSIGLSLLAGKLLGPG